VPTYEYECCKCKKRFDRFQRITEPPVEECPFCKGKVRRLISGGAGIIFKGSGFYITDHRSSDYKKKAREESKAGSSGTSSSSDK
jgi:putative FmdB family regulatory protein